MAHAHGKVKKHDGPLKRLRAALAAVDKNKPRVKVGFVASKNAKRDDSTLTNAQVAIFMEYGTSTVPPRPFLLPAIRENHDQYVAALNEILKRALAGELDFERGLNALGAKAAADVKRFIVKQDPSWAPLAPATIKRKEAKRRKGNKNPVKTLIDTTAMLNSISWVVEGGGEGGHGGGHGGGGHGHGGH